MKRRVKNPLLTAIGSAVILCGGLFSATAQEVRIIRGASSASSIPQLGRLSSAQPKPLSTAQKLQAAQSVVGRSGTKASSLMNPIVLAPGNLSSGSARLKLLHPTYVEANNVPMAAFLEPASEKVIVSFKPPAPGFYLVDFNVDGTGPFTLAGNGVVQSTLPASGHLMFVAEVTPKGVIVLSLEAEGVWVFYSCEISQIK